MPTLGDADGAWPTLAYNEWADTYATLHLWTQIVGKSRLALAPMVNHWWQTALYVSARGLTTSLIPYGVGGFEVQFDFLDHALHIRTTVDGAASLPLEPRTVADFYAQYMAALRTLAIEVQILARPVEVEPAVPFAQDTQHASYDADAAQRCWTILVQAARVLHVFRSGFIGKTSPVHFFWGAFDLALTRFSGRTAPPHPGGAPNVADWVMREAYSHEVASAGFWPGSAVLPEPAFYAYAYPEPDGYSAAAVQPAQAYYHPELREFILPYEAVRTAASPDQAILLFLQSTYDAAADLARWDRANLERR